MNYIQMRHLFILYILCCFTNLSADTLSYITKRDIPYLSASVKEKHDAYRVERCKLDVYYPENKKNFPTVVFFHGGGLEGGEKYIPKELLEKGIAVVSPNYRLSPNVHHPAYIKDAAEAVAWTLRNIDSLGGDPSQIYLSGHSAGGYLTLMLALDKQYLEAVNADADSLAGFIPLSGQTNTHYTIRKERNERPLIPVIDEYAPIYHARRLHAPIWLITGDRQKELLARYTENLHLQDILIGVGNNPDNVLLYELNGFDHGTMVAPGCYLLLEMVLKNGKQ